MVQLPCDNHTKFSLFSKKKISFILQQSFEIDFEITFWMHRKINDTFKHRFTANNYLILLPFICEGKQSDENS